MIVLKEKASVELDFVCALSERQMSSIALLAQFLLRALLAKYMQYLYCSRVAV